MTLLTIAQDVADAVGFPQPSSVVGSSDKTSRRLLRLLNQEGRDLARRYDWEVLTKEASFTTVATESQGAFSSLGGGPADYSDFDRIVNGTINNRTDNEPVQGPLSVTQWQRLKADEVQVSSFYWFRVRGGELLLYPTPSAGKSIYFEYISKNWCQASGGTEQSAWAADTDIGILREELMTLGGIWRFKKSISAPYQDEFNEYETAVRQESGRDGADAVLNMGGAELRDTLNLPNGNFTL